ncbi:MAG: cell division protein [Proteobacteria bacterium]|nr:cell division protein [Pseudomonadota bacterium]
MFRRRTDIPLARDGSARFVPWIVALMVYLAALAAAAGVVTGRAVDRWAGGLDGTLTIEILPDAGQSRDNDVQAVLDLLRGTAGVRSADELSPDAVAALLAPWLGEGALAVDLPVPRLIDVRLERGTLLDVAALRTQIEGLVPGARMDDHRLWRQQLASFARAVAVAAIVVVTLIALAAASTIVFATRAGLAIHHDVIELLHLIGSRENYIARQFQNHAMWLALRGGAVGALLGALTLLSVGWAAAPLQGSFLPDLAIGAAAWIAVAAMPVAAALVATVAARITVLRALRKML